MRGQGAAEEEQPNPIATWLAEWRARTPPACRFLLSSVVICYVAGLLTSQAAQAFANVPYFVVFHYEGAQWLSSAFVAGNFLDPSLLLM